VRLADVFSFFSGFDTLTKQYLPVLSHFQAGTLLTAHRQGKTSLSTTADLGVTVCEAILDNAGVAFPGRKPLPWDTIEKIAAHPNACYYVKDNEVFPIKGYSDFTGRTFSLMPTKTAPAMIVAGFSMHRIKDTDPLSAAQAMINTIAPVCGHVLDTATGLGYTAICAAQTAQQVTTIELDPVAHDMARLNPWSRNLFYNPKIIKITGDAAEEITKFADRHFDRILHDPPAVNLAGDLYSGVFYRQLFRVLKPGGRVFHYIGDPESSSGSRTTRGVVRRLGEAGFGKVVPQPKAFGVVAFK
jgi:uncharacterized protein